MHTSQSMSRKKSHGMQVEHVSRMRILDFVPHNLTLTVLKGKYVVSFSILMGIYITKKQNLVSKVKYIFIAAYLHGLSNTITKIKTCLHTFETRTQVLIACTKAFT